MVSFASHILGGEIFYDHIAGTTYKVTLVLYMDCGSSTDETNATIYAYPADGSASLSTVLPRTFNGFVDDTYFLNPCLTPPAQACMRKSIYEGNMNLANGKGGWDLSYEQFARSAALANITLPDNYSSIYFAFVPDPNDPNVGVPNSSPRFVEDPPASLCINDLFFYDHSAVEPDGDSISYSMCNPKGNAGAAVGGGPPYPDVPFCCGYTPNNPMAATVPLGIDAATGMMSGEPNTNGKWVYSVCYQEFRNGVLISEGTRDYVFSVTNCSPVTPTPGVVAQGTATTDGWCGELEVNFQNGSTNALYYHWDFGVPDTLGDTSNLENPTWVYDSAGVYTVMLIANPRSDCPDTAYQTFQVFPGTDASFIPPGPQCEDGNSFDFDAMNANPGDSIHWDFGGGTPATSNLKEPTGITYPGPGTYSVTLTVTNPTCTSQVTHDITVLASPFPYYQKPDPQCITGNAFSFIGQGASGPGSSYSWDFGPNATPSTSGNQNVLAVNFQDTGYHHVTLSITDGSGCVGTYLDSVYVSPPPQPSFAPTDTQCQNNSKYVFINTGEYGPTATFNWNFGNSGLPSTATSEHVDSVHFATSGEHVVTLSISEYGCTTTYTDTVYVADAPYAFIFPEDNQCFLNQDFDFEGGGIYGPGAKFLWVLGPNASVDSVTTLNVNNVTFDTTGTFMVEFQISESGCTDVFAMPVKVTAKPEASFPLQGDACLSDGPFDFINTGSFDTDATFFWDFGPLANPTSSTDQDVLGVTWATPGTYTVCLTISENGCDSTYCETFTLTPAPLASYDSVAAQCVGSNSFNFNNTGTYGPNAVFTWNFGPATPSTSSLENPSNIVFTTAGFHPVSLSITENNCTDVYTDTVYVSAIPAPDYNVPAPQCVDNNSFDFTAAGTFGPDANFTWDFGPNGPTNSTAQNPTGIVFSQAGYQTVVLTIEENGCTTSHTDSVFVSPAPVPFFASPAHGCVASNSYSFVSAGTNGTAASFNWDFGPNASPVSSTQQNPTGISFNTVGKHPVQLSVTEYGCTYTYVDTVVITEVPTAFTPAQSPECVSINQYDFLAQGTYGDSATFFWDFGPNGVPNTSTDKDALNVSFNTVGTQNVSLTISENGCSDTYNLTVDITAAPGADFQPNAAQCLAGNNFNFQTLGLYGPAATFSWDFGSNASPSSSVAENPNGIVFNSIGWHVITLTVDENGCPNTYTDSVEVTASPVAGFPAQPRMCVDVNSFDFVQNGSSGSNATYNWTFGPNASPASSTLENPTGVTFNAPGNYTVSLTISENGCSDTYTDMVTVTASPQANFARPTGQCVDVNSFNFTAGGTYGADATFSWNFGPAGFPSSSSVKDPTNVSFQDSGKYVVELSVTENGCTDTYLDTVYVYPIPTVDFNANQTGCAPLTVSFQNNSFAWTKMDYLWNFGDGNFSTEENPVHIYQFPGTFNVSLQVTTSKGCVGTYNYSAQNYIQAFVSPEAGLLVTPDTTISIFDPIIDIYDLSSGSTNMQVLLSNGDPIPSLPMTYTFADTGTFFLTQIVENEFGCYDTLQRRIRVDPKFQFFAPNAFSPNHDNINDVYYQKGYGIKAYHLMIFTRWGELVFETNDIKEGWDGVPLGKSQIAKQDTYIWKAEMIDSFGQEHTRRGEIILFN